MAFDIPQVSQIRSRCLGRFSGTEETYMDEAGDTEIAGQGLFRVIDYAEGSYGVASPSVNRDSAYQFLNAVNISLSSEGQSPRE